MKIFFLVFLLFAFVNTSSSQTTTDVNALQRLADEQKYLSEQQRQEVIEYTQNRSMPIRFERDGVVFEMQYIDKNGKPQYLITNNTNSAKTISVNEVYSGGSAGLSLDGSGVVVRQWDVGSVLATHQEFGGRAANLNSKAISWHSTHVAGTIMAAGIVPDAKGLAFAASLRAFDWDLRESEMASEAILGAQVSNHSYSFYRGWQGTAWWGDPGISEQEDYLFGFYDAHARLWDEVAYYGPFHLIVKSASNERGNSGDGSYPPDGPYDCIPQMGVAKNILTVGAVYDIIGGYTQPSDVVMAGFSSWGPVDDGRIKPDIVANGTALYSTDKDSVNDYRSLSGTSMSAPSVTASLALLIQYYENLNGSGSKMRAATLKALAIHTADEAGSNDGPDYEFGWGLMNTLHAIEKIGEDPFTDVLLEHVLLEGESYSRTITTTGTDSIKVTLVWTDYPGTPPSPQLDPIDVMLVSDLDLKVSTGNSVHYPWKLDRDNPSSAATRATENNVDNVEVVSIDNPLNNTVYTITVDHDGNLYNGSQAFSLIISGSIDNAIAAVADFFATNTNLGLGEELELRDASANIPTTWLWAISPTTFSFLNGTDASSQNPQIEFLATGDYSISLSSTNVFGGDTKVRTDYISVTEAVPVYCRGSGGGDEYISGVEMGHISNVNTAADGYSDYTMFSTDIERDSSEQIIIFCGVSYSNDDIGIWVDWNQNKDFYDEDEQVICGVNNGVQGSYSISVPSSAALGLTRMRVRMKYYSTDCGYPCSYTSDGEVEDYSIKVVAATIWTAAVSADWTNPLNWTNGLPDINYNVTIPSSPTGGVFPEIGLSTQAKCNKLIIKSGASVTIHGLLDVDNK